MHQQSVSGSYQHQKRSRLISLVLVGACLWLLLGGAGGRLGLRSASAASDPVIAAAGDIACDPASSRFNNGLGTSSECRQKYTSDLLVNTTLAAVLDLGDNQYYCGGYQAFLQSYDLSWGRVKSITHPSLGNHEYLTSGGTDCNINNEGATGYFDYFGTAAGTRGQGYYSFDIGTWHVIALNSNCSDVGGCGSSSAQYSWLQNDLATHSNECTLAFWHIPYFSSGGRAAANSKAFWNLLYAYNADLILNGHDHIYERFAPQDPSAVADPTRGIREFIVGTGGASHTSITAVAANSELRNSSTYGILKLTLHPSSYDWQFVPESGKSFTDSGTGNCHGNASTPTPTTAPTSTPTSSGPTSTPTPTSTPGTGQSMTFLPQADAYVNSSSPSTNYGSSTSLRADGSPDVHSYARFSITGLGGTQVTRARLLFYMNSGSNSELNALSVADNTWGEKTINYSNAPALGSLIGSSGTLTSGTWVSIDVTSYVTGEGTYSFGINTPGSTAVSFASRESGGNAPELTLDLGASSTSTPTPTTSAPTPTRTSTPTPTATALLPTATNTPTPTVSLPAATPTNTPTPTPTAVAPTPTSTPTPLGATPTDTVTATPGSTSVATDTPTATPTPSGQSMLFTPEADAYVNSSNPSTNYGSALTLRADGSPDVHSYVRFSVQGLNAQPIARVRLLFYANSGSTAGLTAQAVSDNSWLEKGVTYTNAPPLGSVVTSAKTVTAGVWVSLDLTGYVTADGTYSFGITTPGSTAISLASRESGANAPQLIVDFGP